MTSRTKWLMMSVFVLALLAGTTGGLLLGRRSMGLPVSTAAMASLSDQLQLTPQQRDQMRKIWEQMSLTADDCYRQAQQLDQEREDGYKRLLTAEQFKQYQAIQYNYQDRYTALEARRRKAFDQSVAQTKAMLDSDQQQRYQAILDRRAGALGRDVVEPQKPSTPATATSGFSLAQPLASPG